MLPSKHPHHVASLLLAVLLFWLAVYPGTFASPYVPSDSDRYQHEIVPKTAAGYNKSFTQAPTYNYTELSPTAQTFVDRTLTAANNEYNPPVCKEFVLTCDMYTRSELPKAFTYGDDLDEVEASVVIRKGNKQYLLRTGDVGHDWFVLPLRQFTAFLTMIPVGAVVGWVALVCESRRCCGFAFGIGGLVGAIGFTSPYIEMVVGLQAQSIGFLTLGGVWLGFLAMRGTRLEHCGLF